MATVLVISLSDLGSDPRVDRQVDFLRQSHRVIAAGFGPPAYEEVRYVPLRDAPLPSGRLLHLKLRFADALRMAGLNRWAYWSQPQFPAWRQLLSGIEADAIVVNDTICLPLAFSIAPGTPVVFDAHEYSPTEYEASWRWRLSMQRHNRWICRRYLTRAAGMMAVGRQIADWYTEDTGVPATVVTNAPRYEQELEPSPVSSPIRMVHFGIVDPQRRLQDTIDAMRLLGDGYELDLLLNAPASDPHMERIRERVDRELNVRLLPTVPMRDLPRFANDYDIGVHMLPPLTSNARFALPNKFFEYIQARIVPAIGPSPEMARIVREWDCGIVAGNYTPEALAAAIREATPERLAEMKRNADSAARELCAERNREIVLGVVGAALGGAENPSPAAVRG